MSRAENNVENTLSQQVFCGDNLALPAVTNDITSCAGSNLATTLMDYYIDVFAESECCRNTAFWLCDLPGSCLKCAALSLSTVFALIISRSFWPSSHCWCLLVRCADNNGGVQQISWLEEDVDSALQRLLFGESEIVLFSTNSSNPRLQFNSQSSFLIS